MLFVVIPITAASDIVSPKLSRLLDPIHRHQIIRLAYLNDNYEVQLEGHLRHTHRKQYVKLCNQDF